MQESCGTSTFENNDDFTGKVKISTVEGSSIAVPCEDILKWASIYARRAQSLKLDMASWQDVLGGKA